MVNSHQCSKAIKGTQSTNPNHWSGLILFLSTTRMLIELGDIVPFMLASWLWLWFYTTIYLNSLFEIIVFIFQYLHRERKKDTRLLSVTSQMLTDFQNSFTGRLTSEFSIKSLLNILPHLNHVATLPCEISVLKKLSCSITECSRLRCKTQPLKKVVEKYLLVWYLLTLKSKIICLVM